MNELFKVAKKEVLTFLVSVIFLAFLVGLLTNIVFDAFYTDHKKLFVWAVVLSLLISSALAFLLLTSTQARSTKRAQLNFTFDRNTPAFKDIPNCVSSVHARMYFEKLEQKHKEYLSTLCALEKFHDSDLSQFVNQLIQEILIGLVVDDKRNLSLSKVLISQFPNALKNNKYLQKWLGPEKAIRLPNNYKILMEDSEKPCFNIASPYGTVKIKWSLVIANTPYFTASFLETLGSDIKDNCRDIYSVVEAEVKLNYWMMLSEGTKQFVAWSTGVTDRLTALDWSLTEQKLPLVLMEEIVKKINVYVEK